MNLTSSRAGMWSFFWLLARRDLKTRYAGSTLGALWTLIHPITMILVYIAVFSSLMASKSGPGGHPLDYAVHLCSGMLIWLVFSEVMTRSVTVLVDNGNFLKKIWFPPVLLHASVLFNVLIVYAAGYLALVLFLLIAGQPVPVESLKVLGVMFLVGVSASGLGMILSGLNVFFKDMAQILLVVLQFGFWFNPVVYPISQIQKSPLGDWSAILHLNPIEHFVSLAQYYFGDPLAAPASYALHVIFIFPPLAWIAGYVLFRRMLPDIRDGL